MANWAILLGFIVGGIARGVLVGVVVVLVSLFFTNFGISNVFLTLFSIAGVSDKQRTIIDNQIFLIKEGMISKEQVFKKKCARAASASRGFKILQFFRDAPKRFRKRANASEQVRMGPNRSQHVHKLRQTCKNFQKFAKISKIFTVHGRL